MPSSLCFLLQYILNDREVQVKTKLWMEQNAEYLKEQKGEDRASSSSHELALFCESEVTRQKSSNKQESNKNTQLVFRGKPKDF